MKLPWEAPWDLARSLRDHANMLRGDGMTPLIFPERMEEAADKIEDLENALRLMPDMIDLFRLAKGAGRKRVDMVRAIAERIEEIRRPRI